MKVRDSHATINGDNETIEMPSGGIDVVADDGKSLFYIYLVDNGLEVRCASFCKHNGIVLDNTILVKPKASNSVLILREKVNN